MARALVLVVVTLALFAALFLAVLTSPGLLLAAFAIAYAADARALSQVVDRRRRTRQVVDFARRYRGGWLDSPARLT